jgi:hypothetical protein
VLYIPLATFSGVGWSGAVALPHRVPGRATPPAKHQHTILAYLVALVKRQEVRFGPPTEKEFPKNLPPPLAATKSRFFATLRSAQNDMSS